MSSLKIEKKQTQVRLNEPVVAKIVAKNNKLSKINEGSLSLRKNTPAKVVITDNTRLAVIDRTESKVIEIAQVLIPNPFSGGVVPNATDFLSTVTIRGDLTMNGGDIRLSLGDIIRAQVTPGGIYLSAFFVGNGFIGFGIPGFANNIGGRGFTFQNISTVTPGANQILRTANGNTLNSPIGLEGRVNNVLIYSANSSGFNLEKGLAVSNITTVNVASYNVLATDVHLSVTRTATGACTIQLPNITRNQRLTIKDAGYNAGAFQITVLPHASDTIENTTFLPINTNGGFVTLQANLSTNNWEQV